MDDSLSTGANPAFRDSRIIQGEQLKYDGAGLIAPSITCEVIGDYSSHNSSRLRKGFQSALDGAYPLSNPILDLKNQVVYSVDMVRLEFFFDNQQKLIDCIDKQQVFCSCNTFTSNRIGNYRFMWSFNYANGEDGGYRIEREGEVVEDGDKSVVVKVGYGVVSRGGKTGDKGFIEFNPNKCEVNARRFIRVLYDLGCIFLLKRFDLAIDYSVDRNCVRMFRDRRTYEFVVSSKGGMTEYLGARNAPGRVKVYDKAGEQGLENVDITRVELTCSAEWGLVAIKDHLPVCNDYRGFRGDGMTLALCTIIGDLISGVGDDGKPRFQNLEIVPERYWKMLHKNTRYKIKKMLKKSDRLIEYDDMCILKCVERANSFVI